MRTFSYTRPVDLDAALAEVAAHPDAAFLGGGTNLVDLMRLGVARPGALVDITRLGLDGISETGDGGVRIGAGVRNSDLAAHPIVRSRYPVLSRALLAGASGQLRNLATTGGNLLQRTRCLYFQQVDKPCNKREPGTGCPAREGEHRDLAVLGHSASCVATHPGDMAVALAALDASVEVTGPGGPRVVAADELHRLPGEEPERDTVLERGELITAVVLPPLPAGAISTYRKVRDRASFAFAVTSVAVVLQVADGRIADVRIGLGALAAKPWRARTAEDALRGEAPSAAAIGAAMDAEFAGAQPLRDNAFKLPLTRRLVIRTLLDLTGEVR